MEAECCPKFNPKLWDKKEITWKNKIFLKDKLKCFFYIPLNFKRLMQKNWEIIEKNKAQVSPKEFIVMTDQGNMWRANLYMLVSKEIPNQNIEKISGKFLTKVYEGSYKNMGHWVKDFQEYIKSKNKEIKKMYFYYTTCPKCAKKYGKQFTVILAKI